MNIQEVTTKLNELSVEHKYNIASLQKFRKEKYSRVGTYKIFLFRKTFKKRDYAFHSGGRKELQFNIGEENWGDKKIFRYGIAYSLERSRSEHTLMADLKPSKQRFNQYFKEHSDVFEDFNLWYHHNNKWGDISQVKEIDDNIYKDNNFIFVGKYFNKGLNDLTINDLKAILQEFDRLLPLYVYCLNIDHIQPDNEKRNSEGLRKQNAPANGITTLPELNPGFQGVKKDFIQESIEKKEIGDAGEELVKQYEINHLQNIGCVDLAEQVEIVKDGKGYDILSFNDNRTPKYIEVKTTTGRNLTPFHFSINEKLFAEQNTEHYLIYRLYNYNEKNSAADFYLIKDVNESLLMQPVEFKVYFKSKN